MRALGVDLGERRIGVAVSDSSGLISTPYTVLVRTNDRRADRAELARIVEETGAEIVVVGLPLSLSGHEGPAASAAAEEIAALRSLLEVPVVAFDERLTTVEAARRRTARSAGPPPRQRAGRGERRPSGRRGDPPIDAEAAAVLLEAWLSAGGAGG